MKRKSRGKNVRGIIIIMRKDQTFAPVDDRIYFQVNRRPRKLKLEGDNIFRASANYLTRFKYIWELKRDHKKVVKRLNSDLDNLW